MHSKGNSGNRQPLWGKICEPLIQIALLRSFGSPASQSIRWTVKICKDQIDICKINFTHLIKSNAHIYFWHIVWHFEKDRDWMLSRYLSDEEGCCASQSCLLDIQWQTFCWSLEGTLSLFSSSFTSLRSAPLPSFWGLLNQLQWVTKWQSCFLFVPSPLPIFFYLPLKEFTNIFYIFLFCFSFFTSHPAFFHSLLPIVLSLSMFITVFSVCGCLVAWTSLVGR